MERYNGKECVTKRINDSFTISRTIGFLNETVRDADNYQQIYDVHWLVEIEGLIVSFSHHLIMSAKKGVGYHEGFNISNVNNVIIHKGDIAIVFQEGSYTVRLGEDIMMYTSLKSPFQLKKLREMFEELLS